ncbi:MAG: hypothetical protein KGJ07_01965 [Patescibacteria group bacterium]|nr:hypothetical protein [Patescibacteria group bacterium]MDE2589032.1 hypothetical protein [Patescibacteria group bacterium]
MLLSSQKPSFVEIPCDRCGSKKRVSKRWKEEVPTFTGTTMVEFSQIVCTNTVCQKSFDEILEKETKKREALRLEKETKAKERKENFILRKSEYYKSKSRI